MAFQPPTLPPSALAGASAQAKIDQIAVRIINLPDGARNTQPTRLSGTVEGQEPDGTLRVKTDAGDVKILLRDKGNLPQGLKIEIDIPAGRNPQQASVRPQTEVQAAQSPPPTYQTQIPVDDTSSRNPIPDKIPQAVKLQTETLAGVISSSQIDETIDKVATPMIAGGTLQAGQMIRLTPIAPNNLPPNIMMALTKAMTTPELISNFIHLIDTLPKGQSQLRTTLITILSRLDLSNLTPSPTNPSGAINTNQNNVLGGAVPTGMQPISPQTQLINKMNALVQSIGLSSLFKPTTEGASAPSTSATISSPMPTPMSLFNPSKIVDGQILAFQNQDISEQTPAFITLQKPSNIISLQNTPVSPSQVMGFTQDGLPVLSVPLPNTGLTQIYTMQFRADNLTEGTPVFIALDPSSTKPTQALFIQSADGTLSLQQNLSKMTLNGWINSGSWDAMDDLLQTITHLSPEHAQSVAQLIPTPAQPHAMAALSQFFLSLMRTGDADTWVGNETVALLRQMGKSDILKNLASDIALSARIENIALPQDWRMMMLPLLWDNQIHKAPVYYKHLPDEDDKEAAEAKKRRKLRFLFDLNLSRMGGVQVDGFMQSERLDIILRTKSPLSPPMQTQMKRIYAGAMEKSRLTGDLSFQFKPEQWVDFSQMGGETGKKSGLHV